MANSRLIEADDLTTAGFDDVADDWATRRGIDTNVDQGNLNATNISFTDPIAPAYLKTMSDIVNGLPVSVYRFIPNDKLLDITNRANTDNLVPYLSDALDSGAKEIELPSGLYHIDSSLAMSVANQRLVGSRSSSCELRIRSTTAPAITLENGVAGYGLKGLKITRVGVPGIGADGVQFIGTTDAAELEDLWIEGHWNNLVIGTCDTGFINKLSIRNAYNDGVFQTNAINYGPSQWDVNNVELLRNTRDGWRIASTTGPSGLILGQMHNIRSFANSGWAVNLLGDAITGIYDFRLTKAFMGSDGLGSVNIDSFGGKHSVSGFFERNGLDPTGRTLETAPSEAGVGINISAANSDVGISNSIIDDNAFDGIVHSGAELTVTGCQIYNNGAALAVERRNGILSHSGVLIVNGCNITNKTGNDTQEYGIAAGHDAVIITGNRFDNNDVGAITGAEGPDAVIFANSGQAVNKLPAGSSIAVGDPTGTTTAGGINVAGDISQNGVVYTNP